MLRQVRLTITRPLFITDPDADMDAVPSKSVVVPREVLDKALALATTQGFRAPKNHFYPSQTADFARALRAALCLKPTAVTGTRASSRFSTEADLVDFLSRPAQRRYVTRMLDLLDTGGSLDVSDA